MSVEDLLCLLEPAVCGLALGCGCWWDCKSCKETKEPSAATLLTEFDVPLKVSGELVLSGRDMSFSDAISSDTEEEEEELELLVLLTLLRVSGLGGLRLV